MDNNRIFCTRQKYQNIYGKNIEIITYIQPNSLEFIIDLYPDDNDFILDRNHNPKLYTIGFFLLIFSIITNFNHFFVVLILFIINKLFKFYRIYNLVLKESLLVVRSIFGSQIQYTTKFASGRICTLHLPASKLAMSETLTMNRVIDNLIVYTELDTMLLKSSLSLYNPQHKSSPQCINSKSPANSICTCIVSSSPSRASCCSCAIVTNSLLRRHHVLLKHSFLRLECISMIHANIKCFLTENLDDGDIDEK